MNPTQIHPQTVEVPAPLEIHPSVSPLAAELLMKTAEVLMRTPEQYNQGEIDNTCGAPCCIIGHMKTFAGFRGTMDDDLIIGTVGLTISQHRALIWVDNWPKSCPGNRISIVGTGTTPAQGIARIEHFLRTGE